MGTYDVDVSARQLLCYDVFCMLYVSCLLLPCVCYYSFVL